LVRRYLRAVEALRYFDAGAKDASITRQSEYLEGMTFVLVRGRLLFVVWGCNLRKDLVEARIPWPRFSAYRRPLQPALGSSFDFGEFR
jgi:hypothetical protein